MKCSGGRVKLCVLFLSSLFHVPCTTRSACVRMLYATRSCTVHCVSFACVAPPLAG